LKQDSTVLDKTTHKKDRETEESQMSDDDQISGSKYKTTAGG